MTGHTGDTSPNREHVFEFIVAYKRENDGLAPSIKEIGEACLLGESTVRHHLWVLQDEGRIRVVGRRAIQVVGGTWEYED
jgi:hypothetical protein